MSRLADAYRKSRQGISAVPSSHPAAEQAVAFSEGFADLSWSFGVVSASNDREAEAAAAWKLDTDGFDGPFPPAPAVELIRLAQRLFQAPAAGPGLVRSVLFATVGTAPGSAAVCVGTADALSRQANGSVCIVEVNLRSPSLCASFGVRDARGVSNVLLEEAPVANCLSRVRDNLWILGGGSRCSDAQPILSSPRLVALLSQLRSSFDFVLIDSTLAAASPDVTWAAAVDGVVLVIDAGVTRREAARRAADTLRTAEIKVLGAVLANRTYPIPEALYRRL